MVKHLYSRKYLYDNDHLDEVIHQVPVDYYQKGVNSNKLQRIWHTRKLDRVVSAIKKYHPHPKKILDVGAASGWFLSNVVKQFDSSDGVGIDIYKEAIDYGKNKYKNLTFKVSDAHNLPFSNNSFDVVISCEVLEHVVDPNKVVKEMKRVLSDDGIMVVEIDSGNFLFKIVWYWWTNMRKGVWRDSHIHPFTISRLEELFVKNNLLIKEKRIFNLTMAVIFILEKK